MIACCTPSRSFALRPEIAEQAQEWQGIADELWHGGNIYHGLAEVYNQGNWWAPGAKTVSPFSAVRRQA